MYQELWTDFNRNCPALWNLNEVVSDLLCLNFSTKTTSYIIAGVHHSLLCSYIQMIDNGFVHIVFIRLERESYCGYNSQCNSSMFLLLPKKHPSFRLLVYWTCLGTSWMSAVSISIKACLKKSWSECHALNMLLF